jgi:allophanate hydrolase
VPRNPFDPRYIPGGSSSGSAVAVASGLVSFALGTDTAGSGRVPAALNNIVGWKPTPGAVSTEGVVPACRSLDCVSVFALTCGDAALIERTLTQAALAVPAKTFRFGVPASDTLEFFGDPETPGLFQAAMENLVALGGTPVPVDIAPLREVALLLYEGPWIAERTAALKDFLARYPGGILPVTRSIIEGGATYSAVQAFEGLYRLAELKQVITPMWEQIDTLLLPTVATTYTVAEVDADPVAKNSNLGYYTNFVNLLGYAGISVPSEFTTQGLPFGVSLIGPPGRDDFLLQLGDRLHRLSGLRLGATQEVVPLRSTLADGHTILAVAGAHLRGLPLNQQLLEHDAGFVRACNTAPVYRLYELPGSMPPKPGLVRVAENGVSIAVELWQMPLKRFGEFVDLVAPPLGIGSLTLDGGEVVKGFLCESAAVASARDISSFGGWKAFLASRVGGISTVSTLTATSTVCSPPPS